MSDMDFAIHKFVEPSTFHGSFGESVTDHVSCIKPHKTGQDSCVKEFPQKLYVPQEVPFSGGPDMMSTYCCVH